MNEKLDMALHYASMGWHVFPVHGIADGKCTCGNIACRDVGKHPATRRGLHDAVTDPVQINNWFANGRFNVAVRTGECSGIFVVDLDTTKGDVEEKFCDLVALSLTGITGSGGKHVVFRHPGKPVKTRTEISQNVDIRGENGYIVAAPSLHKSGREYCWDIFADYPETGEILHAQEWLLDLVCKDETRTGNTNYVDEPVDDVKMLEIENALTYIPGHYCDDRDEWVKILMAIHSTGHGDAEKIAREWSQQSERFTLSGFWKTWNSIKPGGITYHTIFSIAREHGYDDSPVLIWDNDGDTCYIDGFRLDGYKSGLAKIIEAQRIAEDSEDIEEKREAREFLKQQDDYDLQVILGGIPGALKEIYEWSLETAIIRQPLFSLIATIALGSVLCARRYVTSMRNYSSLYCMAVGPSSAGKDHCRETIIKFLSAGGYLDSTNFYTGGGFTTKAALTSALYESPSHITVIDEFSKSVGASLTNNGNQQEVQAGFLEAFTSVGSVMTSQRYSTHKARQAKEEVKAVFVIKNPALTIMATGTPMDYYKALGNAGINDGFLGRWMVAQVPNIIKKSQKPKFVPPPQGAIAWAHRVRDPGLIENPEISPSDVGEAVIVDFDDDAMQAADDFETQLVDIRNELEDIHMGRSALLGRTKEKAQRLALIGALAVNPDSPRITLDIMQWSIKTSLYFDLTTSREADIHIADNKNDADKKAIIRILKNKKYMDKECYVPEWRVTRHSGVSEKERKPILRDLINGGEVEVITKPGGTGVGRASSKFKYIG